VPIWLSTAKIIIELEGTEDGVDSDADYVQHYGQWCGKKSSVAWCYLHFAAKFYKADVTS
jgi:hypothetical protein